MKHIYAGEISLFKLKMTKNQLSSSCGIKYAKLVAYFESIDEK